MKFCVHCKSLMTQNGENNLICLNCNYMEIGEIVSNEKLKERKIIGTEVADEINMFADYDHVCKKCGFGKAQIVERQPAVSDEDSLLYLKCGKCGYSQKMARKTG